MKQLIVILLFMFLIAEASYSQLSITSGGTSYTIDFDNTVSGVNNGQYTGTGFQPSPLSGRLDSDAWAATGMSHGALNYGGTQITTNTDYTRGQSTGGETTGGFYAFNVGSGNRSLGIQPSSADWTPGTITLRIQNNTGDAISAIALSYEVWCRNDEERANSFNFSHSNDNSSFINESTLDYTSPEASDALPSWVSNSRNINLSGLAIPNGSYYYLRWSGNFVSGGGSVDEFGLDNIVINATSGGVISNESDIVINPTWSEPENIDYTQYLTASGLSTSNSIEVGQFTMRDGGGTNDLDILSTTLTDILFDIDNYENVEAIAIFDGTTNLAEITNVNNATVNFSGLSIVAPDNGEKDFSIYITFKTSVTDNQNLQFIISSATSNAAGSGFSEADAGGASTNNSGDRNKIEVTADRLSINAPANISISNNFTVTVNATDIYDNIDLDESSSVTLVRNSGTGSLTSISGLTKSLFDGTYQWTDLQYNMAEIFRIEAQNSGLINVVSNDINAVSGPVYDLFISEIADPEDISNAKFVELYNSGSSTIDFSTQTWYLVREANGGSSVVHVQIDPTASLASEDTWIVAYDLTNNLFATTYLFSPDQTTNDVVSGNGNDSYFLYYGGDESSGTLVDTYGEWGIDGIGKLWEYEDSKATRKRHIKAPNSTWTASEWVIIPATASEMTPDWHDWDLTWNGGSIDWNDPDNWDNSETTPHNYPPDAGCDIVIPNLSNDPDISDRASTNNMEIETGAVVTVRPTHFLVTGSEIDNNTGVSGLIVKSDASGDGMLLLGSGTTQATIERYLTDDMSHFISAPTSNATADDLYQDQDPEVYLYEFHESNETYNYLVPTSTPMPSGKGFSTWVDDADLNYIIANFDGNLISSDLTLDNSTTPSLDYSGSAWGWNLVGNPYPVPIDWTIGSWDSTNIEGTIYIWDPDANTTSNPDGSWVWKNSQGAGTAGFDVIPGGQAFAVRTQGASPSLTIPANARTVYYNQVYYKSSRDVDEDSVAYQADYVIVKAINDQDNDEVWISFNDFGTEGFDNGWDATKWENTYNTISVYIPKEIRNQCLEHLPTLYPDEERIVEIGFETTVDGEHSLMVDATYMPDTDITLEDLKYNQMQDMDNDSIYTFVAFVDDDPNRFRIHFNKTTTGIEFEDFNHQNDESLQIYSYGKHVYIKKEDISTSGYVMLYDMYGREVLSQQLEQTHLMKIPVQINNSYLVVKVISDNKVFTSKVYIK